MTPPAEMTKFLKDLVHERSDEKFPPVTARAAFLSWATGHGFVSEFL
jgi:hypothetical protein